MNIKNSRVTADIAPLKLLRECISVSASVSRFSKIVFQNWADGDIYADTFTGKIIYWGYVTSVSLDVTCDSNVPDFN